MWFRTTLCAAVFAPLATMATAQSCSLEFTVEITQGVGMIRPGTEMTGAASFTTDGTSIRGEGGTTSHLASGEMSLGDDIRGPIWTLVTTHQGSAADLVGVYAKDVEGLSIAGVPFTGPMALTLFGVSGAQDSIYPPTLQEDWDRMDLRRSFSLQAPTGRDMLAGDVTNVTVDCT